MVDLKNLIAKAEKRDLSDYSALSDLFELCRLLEKEDFKLAHEKNKIVRKLSGKYAVQQGSLKFYDLNKRALLFDAPYDFDAYCMYIEWNRDTEKRFYIPRRKQLNEIVKSMQQLADGELELLGVSLPPGVGKALANDTPILTRNGWKNHGDLEIGDEVIGLDGKFKKVIFVHPKCTLDVLVEFANGEKIQCHENHEWMLHDKKKHRDEASIFETKELEKIEIDFGGEKGKRGHRYRFRLPFHRCVVGEEKELYLDPYTLGVWLGDGTNRDTRICGPKQDYAIIERIIRNGHSIRWETEHKITGVMYYSFDIRKQLQRYGMCYSGKTTEKHIPEEYLTSSIKQRLELLAGLIDTDGTLSGNKYLFSTTSEKLRDDFVSLVSTFGCRCSINRQEPKVSSSGIIGRKPVYVIGFTPDFLVPCSLERKRNKEKRGKRKIAITNIKRVEPKEGNCITVEGDGMYLAGKTLLPTHNTTISLFFITWLAGKNYEKPILCGSHSNAFLRGAYEECLRILNPNGDYLWNDVFPSVHVVKTNAQDMLIDVGESASKGKRFATLEFSSVGSGNAGKVRAEQLLYCDDLISDITQALSKERLDTLWGQYTTDLRQRKIGSARELHVATRWSRYDILSRLEQAYEDNPKTKFIARPALNENDESNFDYGPNHAGFTTKFYHEQRDIMDDASWQALYMNEPIEREGQLYNPDELRRYFELPDEEPDGIFAVCDTKGRGTDYCAMPIVYKYGNNFYVDEFLCDNSNPEIVEARIVSMLMKHNVHMARFESNSAGGKIAEEVQKEIKEKGGKTKITTKYTTTNKETKIIVNSPWVKEHCLFKDDSVIKGNKEYRKALNFLCSYTMAARNKNDDIPDVMSMLAEYMQSFEARTVTVFSRPF